MNGGPTSQRVQDALRRAILEHRFHPGDRLDPAQLASTLASSVTPVREALYLLAGQGLVEIRVSDGFHLPLIDEPALRDRYRWNAELARLALASSRPMVTVSEPSDWPAGPAGDVADLMSRIARLSANIELHLAMDSLNARLHAARFVEPQLLAGGAQELEAIDSAYAADDRALMRRLVAAYCRRRERAAAEIVRALYRSPTQG